MRSGPAGRGRWISARSGRDVDAAAGAAGGDALVVSAAGRRVWGWSHVTVAADLEAATGCKPWRAETFKFSTDPELVAKVTDVVGLYLAPPENAIVLCVRRVGSG